MIRGFFLTARLLGLRVAVLEGLRRFLGVGYWIGGVRVESDELFRLIRGLVLKGFRVGFLEGEVVVETSFGLFKVGGGDVGLLHVLLEDYDALYGCIDYGGKLVVDVGAYIGDTALFFLKRGARRVYAFEPVPLHFKYLLEHLRLNNAGGKVVPVPEGVWHRSGLLELPHDLSCTGLDYGERDVVISVRHIDDALGEVLSAEGCIDVVKMDCEGCEYSLLISEAASRVAQYVIEIHGSPWTIIDLMMKKGYRLDKVIHVDRLVNVVYMSKA